MYLHALVPLHLLTHTIASPAARRPPPAARWRWALPPPRARAAPRGPNPAPMYCSLHRRRGPFHASKLCRTYCVLPTAQLQAISPRASHSSAIIPRVRVTAHDASTLHRAASLIINKRITADRLPPASSCHCKSRQHLPCSPVAFLTNRKRLLRLKPWYTPQDWDTPPPTTQKPSSTSPSAHGTTSSCLLSDHPA